jgi:hypothetical protein
MNTTYTYPDALIYRIVCNETGEVYIGSTVGKLTDRMNKHRSDATQYNNWVLSGCIGKRPRCFCCSIQILDRNNYTAVEIEPYPCNTKNELCLREGDIQIQYKNELGTLCVNMCIAGAFARAGGKVEYNKQYYIDNGDTMREYNKQYRKDNSAKIAARDGVKHNCSLCGGRYIHKHRSQHFRTKVHQDAVQCDTQASAHHDS